MPSVPVNPPDKGSDARELITPTILDDSPKTNGADAQFQFEAYANTLAKLILSRSTKTPLSIGLYGEWGSGKTSLMQIVKTKVDEAQKASIGRSPSLRDAGYADAPRPSRTVWFNAWKYSNEEALWVSLIDEIRREMTKDRAFLGRIKEKLSDPKRTKYNVPEALASTATKFLTGGLIGLNLGEFKEASRFKENVAFYDEFQSLFDNIIADYTQRQLDGVLVIFIDDLDRCLPPKIVQVLEAIKLFMDRPGCVFMIGADPKVVASAVQAHYEAHGIKGIEGAEYLDKIVQIRFELPPLRSDDVTSFIRNLPGLESSTRDYLQLITSGIRTNPRRIKMFVNHMEFQWSLLVNMGLGELKDKGNLAEWLMLNEACSAFREEVQSKKNEGQIATLIGRMKQFARLSPTEREIAVKSDQQLGKLVESATVREVLNRGRFDFSEEELGVYIHLSPAPSLMSRQEELIRQIDLVLDELTEQEKRILQLRFGLKDGIARTLKEVGKEFNLSEERIRQIEGKAFRKLRHPSHSRKLRDYLDKLT